MWDSTAFIYFKEFARRQETAGRSECNWKRTFILQRYSSCTM